MTPSVVKPAAWNTSGRVVSDGARLPSRPSQPWASGSREVNSEATEGRVQLAVE